MLQKYEDAQDKVIYPVYYSQQICCPLPTELEGEKGMALSIGVFVHPSHFWGFRAFTDKMRNGLSSNLVDEVGIGLPSPD